MRETVQAILASPSAGNGVAPGDLSAAAVVLAHRLKADFGCKPRFQVCVAFRGGSGDDEVAAGALQRFLCAQGVRAHAAPASADATALLQHAPI